MKRKMISIFLVCLLVLSGCGKEEATQEQDIVISNEEEGARYEKTELPLPDSLMLENVDGSDYIGNDFDGFVSDLQGRPALYYLTFTIESEEYLATITRWMLTEDGNDWIEEDLCENSLSEFLNQKHEQVEWKRFTIDQFRRGDDGSLYAIFTYMIKETIEENEEKTEMETQKYSVLQIDEENDRVFEIPLADFIYSAEERYRMDDDMPEGLDFTDYHIFEDGNLLFIYMESGGEYGKIIDGETGQTLTELGNIVNGRKSFTFGESEIIFFSNDIMQFQVLSTPELEEDNTFGAELGEDVLGKEWHYYMNPDTWELYLCNETGVYSAVSYADSDEVECLTTNTDLTDLEALSMGDGNILDFFVGQENDFYVCLIEQTEEYGRTTAQFRMLHYQKE